MPLAYTSLTMSPHCDDDMRALFREEVKVRLAGHAEEDGYNQEV